MIEASSSDSKRQDKDIEREKKRAEKDAERDKKRAEKDKKKEEKKKDTPVDPKPDGPVGPPTPKNPPTPITPPADPPSKEFLRLKVEDLDVIEIGKTGDWNIIKVGHGSSKKNPELHSIVEYQGDKTLKINYPKGSYKPSRDPIGGIGFYATPAPIFPEKEKAVTLSYDIYFDESFVPVKGGKLCGLFIGEPGASGGRHSNNQASARLMWRTADGSDKINAEVYLYVSDSQDSSYKKIPNLVENPTFGDSLWRGDIKFTVGQWNRVVLTVKLNTFSGSKANKDGLLSITINDTSRTFDKLVYTEQKVDIEGVTTDTFFGGGSEDWATPNNTSVFMKNFVVYK